MTITISVPDQLATQAADQGLSVEAFVERLANQAIATPSIATTPSEEYGRLHERTVAEAIDHLRSSRKGITLGGLKFKDLVHEGHKY